MLERRLRAVAWRFVPTGMLATFVCLAPSGCASDGAGGAGTSAGTGASATTAGTSGSAGATVQEGKGGTAGSSANGAGRDGASGASTGGGLASGGSATTPSGGRSNGGAGGAASGGAANGGATNAGATNGGATNGGMNTAGGRGGRGAGGGAGTVNTGGAGASGTAGAGGEITVPDGYHLVWHDEFDVDGKPDAKNWKFETGFVRNEEAQWYQTDNASVSGGLLVIEGRQERVTNPNYTGSGDWKTSRQYAEYTSSSLNSSGLQSFQYGRFEMRARIPTSAGMWPAWWTLGVSGEWPSNGEVDIMEYYSGKVLANVACGTSTRWEAKWDSATKSLSSLGAGWSNDFHVWRMDWDDTDIVLYLDDQTLNTTALSSMLNPDGTSPFKQKAYLLVNLALGGNNGGSLSGSTFPVRYEVDYIRVFQKN